MSNHRPLTEIIRLMKIEMVESGKIRIIRMIRVTP